MNDNYSAASGEGIYAGMIAPSSMTALETFIAAMSPNTWAEYTGTNINQMTVNPYDGIEYGILESFTNKPLTNWTNKYCYDAANKIISGVGTAEGYITNDLGKHRSKEITFDMVTNSFSALWNPTNHPEGHGYDGNPSMPMDGIIYRKGYDSSFETNMVRTRTELTTAWQDTAYTINGIAGGSLRFFFTLEVFPELGSSGSLILVEGSTAGPNRVVRFDVATGARTVVGTYADIGEYPLAVYVNGAVIFGSGDPDKSLYRIDSSGTVTKIIDAYPVELSSTGTKKMLACPNGTDNVYTFTNSDTAIRKINTITGAVTDIGTLPTIISASQYVAAATLQTLGAIAFWRGEGRTSGFTTSKFYIYKV